MSPHNPIRDLSALMLRLGFTAALGGFFWRAALTKLDGAGLSAGAYVQILPRLAEAAGYDPAQMPLWTHGIVAAGTAAEFVLPALILIGLLTRGAALGMIGFVLVMSVVDVLGHGAAPAALTPRLIWLAGLAAMLWLGGGRWSLDGLIRRR